MHFHEMLAAMRKRARAVRISIAKEAGCGWNLHSQRLLGSPCMLGSWSVAQASADRAPRLETVRAFQATGPEAFGTV